MNNKQVITVSSLAECAYRDCIDGIIPCFVGEILDECNIVERRESFIKNAIRGENDLCIVIKSIPHVCLMCGNFKAFSDDRFCYDCTGCELVFDQNGTVYNETFMVRPLLYKTYDNNHCFNCYKEDDDDDSLFTCESCQSVKYCSLMCSHNHWPSHQSRCKVMTQKRIDYMTKIDI